MKRFYLLLLVACAGPETTRRSPPPPSPTPIQAPAPVTPPLAQLYADADPGYAFADPDRRTKLATAFPAIDKAMTEELAQQNIGGVSIGVVIDGELAYSKGYGVVDPATKTVPDADTVYRIGSISKSFTALALLSLRDDGVVHLDDPVTKWIPEASGLLYPTHDSPPITLRHLLTHTSGLRRDVDFTKVASEDVFLAQLAKLPLENPPGRVFVYSNLGFALLGIVDAHASHGTLAELMTKRVFGPLGMTSTVWHKPDVAAGKLAPSFTDDNKTVRPEEENLGVAAGAGGIYSSVRDMARYVAFQLSAYPPRSEADHGAIKRSTVRESHSNGFLQGGFVGPRGGAKKGEPSVNFNVSSYGFGWAHEIDCNHDDVVEHNGAIESYRSAAMFLSHHGVGVVVLTNFGNANTGSFAHRIVEALAATGGLVEYKPKAAAVSPALDATMAKFLAVYNKWDEDAMKTAVLARPLDPIEHDELAGYFKLHGACSALTLASFESGRAVFRFTCERGALDMEVFPGPDGRILGFGGKSRDVIAPPEIKSAATTVLSLLAKWDDKLFARAFDVPKPQHDVLEKFSASLRADTGTCNVKSFVHDVLDWGFEATCERGPDLRFDLHMAKDKIQGVNVHPINPSTCPIK